MTEGQAIGCGFLVFLAIVVLLAGAAMIQGVDAGEICVVTEGGNITGTVGPGWHLKWPHQSYHCFTTRTQSYETSSHPDQSDATFTDFPVDSQTNDGQSISLTYTVLYHVPKENVRGLYESVGTDVKTLNEIVVKSNSRAKSRELVRDFDASELYSGQTSELEDQIEQILRAQIESQGLVLEDFLLRNIQFDPDYLAAIEAKEVARENRNSAQYRAEEQRTIAEGERDAAEIEAQGEAEAIRLRGEALREYPEVLQLEAIDTLNPNIQWGVLPADGMGFIYDLGNLTPNQPGNYSPTQ